MARPLSTAVGRVLLAAARADLEARLLLARRADLRLDERARELRVVAQRHLGREGC